MLSPRFEYLFNCHLQNNCTVEETEELMALLMKPENEALVQQLIDKVIEVTGPEIEMPSHRASSILQNILQKDKTVVSSFTLTKTIFSNWVRVAAAVIIVSLTVAIYWLWNKKDIPPVAVAAKKELPNLPDGNKAMLTLSNGHTVILDSVPNGTLACDGSTNIDKRNGLLIYNDEALLKPGEPVSYNTLSTPRGVQYQVILPDGSKVWLNAASSLRFPTAFNGSRREVQLSGEAYFEVAKNKAKPFQVHAGIMQVNVLGTHFDVKAYNEEKAIKTTLLEGSVKVIKDNSISLLKPGQQAVLNKKEATVKVKNVDMNEVTAWKNGLFLFEDADITEIMQQIVRWYDVEIVYAGKIPEQRFEGKISRTAALSEVLQILQLSNVKFKVDGKKIMVL